jgi:CRP/FNR family transcriptional regulator, cyclic AMP receptor protein
MTNLEDPKDVGAARAVLATRGWLTKTPAVFRDAVLSHSKLHSFAAGETIYAQGDIEAGLWGLASGTIGVELSGRHRDPRFAYFTGTGFWIGAHTLVMGPARQVGLVALRPSQMLHLPGTAFTTITQQQSDAWRWLAVLPLLQNALAFGILEDLLIRDPQRRCAAILLRLAGCRGPLAIAEPEDIFVTQEQLAEMINLSRTALGDVLRGFEKKGYISRRYGKLTIVNALLEDVVNGVSF